MNETGSTSGRTSLWNMDAPLRVLLIENSEQDAALNLHELERAGFQCRSRVIATRKELLDLCPRFPFDIVLADYRLPGWNGMDAFAAIREAGRDVPFVLVTGFIGEEAAVECIKQGVTDYVLKDHLPRLSLVVARALEERALRDARSLMFHALRESEANALFLFAHNPLPMWVFERETLRFLQVNDAALHLYGYDRPDLLQMQVTALHLPEEVQEFLAALESSTAGDQLGGEWRLRKKDRSVVDVEMFLHKMEYSGRSCALVVTQDITERKRAEDEKQKFFTLVEYSRDFIAVADLHDNVEYVNPAGRAMLGIPDAQSIKDSHFTDYVNPSEMALVHGTILPALHSSGHWQGELRFRHRPTGKAIPMDFVGFQVRDQATGRPRFVATVSRDMSERRALEQQLRQAQKFEAIGQLAGGIAHDFNNVIGAILGWAELGEDQAASQNPQLSSYFSKIHSQCDRVTDLVRQLLAFSRQQILEPCNMSLNQTVRDVLNLLDKVIGKDVEIKFVLASDLMTVRADPAQIEQVLMNLCINSRDAMPHGGRLTIETRNAEFSEQDCQRTAGLQPGRFAELRVTDTGIGMNDAVREKIFEPFFTTKTSGNRTGLGLATVYGIIKQHGGFVLAESELGRGSTFRTFLCAGPASANRDCRTVVVEEAPSRGGHETVLIAEDHDALREVACSALKKKGYEILLARDGQEAIDLFTAHRERISLVILDVIMPQRSGPQVYQTIKRLEPKISVLFATGYSDEAAELSELVERGATILRKPYSPALLCRRVREVLDERTAPSGPYARILTEFH
jgi:two-component system, cell cycle sensor histidine kinase and response regulator CckA